MVTLKTNRLTVRPMSDSEMEKRIETETDEHFREAVKQMLAGSKANPGKRLWYCLWKVSKKDGEAVGTLAFMGAPENGAVEIGYGINAGQRGQHFGREAAVAAVKWALSQNGVYFVEAECERTNKASIDLLTALGFVEYGTGEEGIRYYKEKSKPQNLTLFMCVGMCVGVSFGLLAQNIFATTGAGISTGIGCGLALGVGLGAYFDASENKKRSKCRALRGYVGNKSE